MTFSIAARSAETGQFGVAISSSSICIGSRCPWVRAKVGAVSTQNVTLPSIGPAVLDEIGKGADASRALQSAMSEDEFPDYRQVIVVDRQGNTANHNGSKTLGINGVKSVENCIAAGNLLENPSVPAAMVDAFLSESGVSLPARLLAALEAGSQAGGESGPVHSSALMVASEQPWPLVNIRVDWSDDDPVLGLRALWEAYAPQMDDYVKRALNPTQAPRYGVPGED